MASATGRTAWHRWRVLLLWVVVLVALGTYLWLVDLPRERTARETSEQTDTLLAFDPIAATALVLKTFGPAITLTKDQAGTWQILSPLKIAADQAAVRSLLVQLAHARRLRLIDERPTALEPYGLDPAPLTLRITVGGVEHQLDFGGNSPIGSSAYVRVWPTVAEPGRAASVWLVPLEIKEAAAKNLYDLRNKELFDVAADTVTALELRYPDQSTSFIRLERQPAPAQGQASPADWVLVAPIHTAADHQAVETLVKQIRSLRATAILDTGKVEKLATLKRPKVEATMWMGGRSAAVRLYLPFGEEAAYAVTTTPEAPLYQVDRQAVLQFEKSLFDLRDKRVAQIRPETVQRLQIEQSGGRYQLTRRGDQWLLNEQPLSQATNQKFLKFLDELWRAKVEKIAGDTTAAWPKLGLRDGATIITLFSGDNSTIQPVVVRFGKKEGELLYIRRGTEADSYITASPLSDLLQDLNKFSN